MHTDRLKFSIVVPFKGRERTLRVVLAALAEQTMDQAEFEVVVGAMEYSTEYVELCREFTDRLTVVSVMTTGEWNVARARNLAIRHASGEVVMTLDADIALPPDSLRNTYDRYFAHGQNLCVIGQVVGYEAAMNEHSRSAKVLPWDHYRAVLADLAADGGPWDYRWTDRYASALMRFPWAFVATGLTAIPRRLVEQHDLYFDENFRGWGPEDQEWGFRISRAHIPIVHAAPVFGLHLPHPRDLAVNEVAAWTNNRYYLAKWPRLDLELALAFGWIGADECYAEVERELAACRHGGRRPSVLRGPVGGRDTVVVGALVDPRTQAAEPDVAALFDRGSRPEILPLTGFALPYPDRSVDEVRVLAAVTGLSPRYREAIRKEATRVAAHASDVDVSAEPALQHAG
ncbi:glycosyltransferase family 2 protein [Micromonospora sp. NBC_00617]|uniref:glycosyltransferase family 2 protein n=1 Tax=Micromonospora sp. NBC_00617 TaxID=2903587 RepID=UPI0030E0DF21